MDLNLLHLFLLAVVQGVAEFLPISSSAHLLITSELWQCAGGSRLPDFLGAEIMLHGGTLLSILVVYRHRIAQLLGEDRRMIGRLVVGTLPAVIVGLPLHEMAAFRAWLENPLLASCLLPVTGAILIWAGRCKEGFTEFTQITYRQALLIGMAQAIAILPGISRSGATISAGLLLGMRRDAAASFSFLLAIPTIGGAVVLGARHWSLATLGSGDAGSLFAAALLALVVGIGALTLLLRWLREGRLQPLAWWCIGVGAAFTAWQLAGEPLSR